MTPGVIIEADGKDITASIMDRLIEVEVQDSAGFHNDKLTLEIDDRTDEGFIRLPPDGTVYRVSMGYLDMPNQDVPAQLTFMGEFIQDEIEVEGGSKGRTFRINGHAVSSVGPFKQTRTRSYHETTLGEIVQECAERNGLEAVIAPGFESIYVQHLDQTNESDSAFLTRLYDLYGAVAKPINGKLLFGPPDGIRELQGDFDQQVVIDQYTVLDYRYLSQGRGKFKKVKAAHYNKDTGELEIESDGEDGDPPAPDQDLGREDQATAADYQNPETYASSEEAKRAAGSKKSSFDNSECSLHFTVIGDPYIMAGGTINLINFRPEIPTEWHVTKVVHKWEPKRFVSEVSADTKFGKGLDADGNPLGGGDGDDDGPPAPDQDLGREGDNPNNEAELPTKDEGAQVQIMRESPSEIKVKKTQKKQEETEGVDLPPEGEDETGNIEPPSS